MTVPLGLHGREPTPDEIEALLDSGRETELIGVAESDSLDFKQQPHQLGTDRGKWDGRRTWPPWQTVVAAPWWLALRPSFRWIGEEEIASEVTPFPADMVNVKQHRDALDARSGVYPTLRDVRILPFDRDDGKALLLVVVPRQDEDQRPFLVVRMVEGDEKRGIGVDVMR